MFQTNIVKNKKDIQNIIGSFRHHNRTADHLKVLFLKAVFVILPPPLFLFLLHRATPV